MASASPDIVLYGARDCSLCEGAQAVLDRVTGELGLGYRKVDIGGVPELEAAYRASIPVVEIDGERAFTYFVSSRALRDRLAGRL